MTITRDHILKARTQVCHLHADLLSIQSESTTASAPLKTQENLDKAQLQAFDLTITLQDAIDHIDVQKLLDTEATAEELEAAVETLRKS